MHDPGQKPQSVTVMALLMEGALAVFALLVGWLIGFWPLSSISFAPGTSSENAAALGWGVLAVVPMLVGLILIESRPWSALRTLKGLLRRDLIPMFAELSVIDLALISLAAGVGEEIAFRGLVQAGLSHWLGEPYGVWLALAAASVLFGVCHFLTRSYAIIAGLIGVYLGLLFIWTDNLLAPITAHAVYDFVALLYYTRWQSNVERDFES